MKSIADIRKDFTKASLEESEVLADPIKQFERWFGQSMQVLTPEEVISMTLATADGRGRPSARTVLLKEFDECGFVFFTNYESRKGRQIAENPYAALLFFWHELERQVHIEGKIEKIGRAESATYFHSRPTESQIGAWASRQSSEIPNRTYLDDRVRTYREEFREKEIQLPPYWGGFRVIPEEIEFWQGRASRLHDRIRYTRREENIWKISRLSP